MADKEGKQQQGNFSANGVAAGALASVAAAFFTSRLGVAGTLIGAAVTSLIITIGSAITKASLERASGKLSEATTKISGLPTTVRGRRATQQVRVPGSPDPAQGRTGHPDDEPTYYDDEGSSRRSRRERRRSGPFARLGAAVSDFGLLPAGRRRKVLVAGALSGVAATTISLLAITGIETVIGHPLSSVGRGDSSEITPGSAASESSRDGGTSVGRSASWLFSGSRASSENNAPSGSEAVPSVNDPAVDDPSSDDGGLFGNDGSDGSEAPVQDGSETPPVTPPQTPQEGVTPAPDEAPQEEAPVVDPVVPEEPAAEPVPEEVPEEAAPVQSEGEAVQ